jgi:hypothetical protein
MGGLLLLAALVASPPDEVRFRLDNGLLVILKDTRRARAVGVSLRLPVGLGDDPPGAPGAARLLGRLGGRSATERELAKREVVIRTDVWDALQVDYELPQAAFLTDTLAAIAERLQPPPLDALDEELAALEADAGKAGPVDRARYLLAPLLQAVLHGRTGAAPPGRDALAALARERIGPAGSVLVIVGDARTADTRPLVERKLAALEPQAAGGSPPAVRHAPFAAKRHEVKRDPPGVALLFPTHDAPPAERVVLTLFGNLLAPRLEGRVPDGTGFPLTSSRQYPPGRLPFFVWIQLKEGATAKALEGMLRFGLEGAILEPWEGKQQRFEVDRNELATWLEGRPPNLIEPPPGVAAASVFATDARDTAARETLHGGDLAACLTTIRGLTTHSFGEVIRKYLRNDRAAVVLVQAPGK